MNHIKQFNLFQSPCQLIKEKYNYIGIMEFTDDQLKKLNEIQEVFSQIPTDKLEQCVMDLENIGFNYFDGCLTSFLWKGYNLNTSRTHTSDGISFNYLCTSDFYNKINSNIFDNIYFKVINAELIQSLWSTKTEQEITQVFANEMIKNHFHNSILREIEQFDDFLSEGYIPCVSITKLSFLKNWTLNPVKVDVVYEFKQRVNALCGYEIVFAPSVEQPSIVLVDKKYIR